MKYTTFCLAAETNQSMDPHTKIQFVLEEQNLSPIKRLPYFSLANKVKLLGLQWPFVLITVQI
jgi:hypothetical protein